MTNILAPQVATWRQQNPPCPSCYLSPVPLLPSAGRASWRRVRRARRRRRQGTYLHGAASLARHIFTAGVGHCVGVFVGGVGNEVN